jgi:hypothetical protein
MRSVKAAAAQRQPLTTDHASPVALHLNDDRKATS